MKPFKINRNGPSSLLIATDFSESSTAALMQGFNTASLWGANPHVLHVCHQSGGELSIDHDGVKLLLTPQKGQALVAEHVDGALQRYRSMFGEPAFDVAVSHIAIGDPAEAIVQFAQELQVSMIVVGTSRKHGLERMLLGSTAEKVVRHATVPVLVSRQPEPSPAETLAPACAACVDVRRRSKGAELWCEQHRKQQERRHTYHYRDSNARAHENLPLLIPMAH